jgi:hypothetical protein
LEGLEVLLSEDFGNIAQDDEGGIGGLGVQDEAYVD